jgi:hypothetical protein
MEQSTPIDFPLRGEWACLRPPGHHPLALDFMAVGNGSGRLTSAGRSRFVIGGIAADRFYGWGSPVHAPLSGTVVRASDGWPDRTNISLSETVKIWFHATFLFRPKLTDDQVDIRPNVGNFVMLRNASGVVAFLAHLRSGSLRVKVGQNVSVGEFVAEVGNSGNSTAPHLHLNLFDQVDDLLKAKVIPFVFRRYLRRNGAASSVEENTLPSRGDLVSSCAER